MTVTALLFALLYWPCIRLSQIMHRLSKGMQLGSEHGTVIGIPFLPDLPYWITYFWVLIELL
jgi:hypothetical protein